MKGLTGAAFDTVFIEDQGKDKEGYIRFVNIKELLLLLNSGQFGKMVPYGGLRV